jgi:DNA modification methylase
MKTTRILVGDCRTVLRALPAESIQCCVTSPPYYGLRDYGHENQIGLEQSPDAYVAELVAVFREVWRVLRDDGVLFLNIGDSYCSVGGTHEGRADNQSGVGAGSRQWRAGAARADGVVDKLSRRNRNGLSVAGAKAKDLLMIPAQVALALRADGWYLRSDTIWAKPNPMPESVTDRPTSAHEHVFLLTKSARYFWDADAVAQNALTADRNREKLNGESAVDTKLRGFGSHCGTYDGTRNIRNVWTIATQPYSGAHFATMPPELAGICIKAGNRDGGLVLDPFGGSGTTGMVAQGLGHESILIELNPEYAQLAKKRIAQYAGLFSRVVVE